MKHRCSYPGCEVRTNNASGRCTEGHGMWYACNKHTYQTGFQYKIWCPVCYYMRPETQDQIEADKRNLVVDVEWEQRIQTHMTGFRAQGYGEEAARAMAEREAGPVRHRWSASSIESERNAAKLRAKARAGEIMRCPVCKETAPSSDGIVLKHTYTFDYSEGGAAIMRECTAYGIPGEVWDL